MQQEWKSFNEGDPEKSGDYFVYRNANGVIPRIFIQHFSKKYGWCSGFGRKTSDWTHYFPITKPKPPKA